MNSEMLLSALEAAAPEDILHAGRAAGYLGEQKKRRKPAIRVLLVAAVVGVLLAGAVCADMVLGIWNDRWVQSPAADPAEAVRSAVENQTMKEYTVSVAVESVREDPAEARKVYTGARDSMLALRNGWADHSAELAEKCGDIENFKAMYCVYNVEYDHTKTWYTDGRLGQWFYLIRDAKGRWEIWDSCDAAALDAPAEPVQETAQQTEAAQVSAPEPRDVDGAVQAVIAMVQKWELFDDVDSITVDAAECSSERRARALEVVAGSPLAEENGWTEDYLKNHMAAVEITYTTVYAPTDGLPAPAPETETSVYYLLRDPAAGEWRNSEITGYMDGIE